MFGVEGIKARIFVELSVARCLKCLRRGLQRGLQVCKIFARSREPSSPPLS